MNEYRERSTGQVVSDNEFRNSFENHIFPPILDAITLDSMGYDPILETPIPTVAFNQVAIRSGTTQDTNNNWIYNWDIVTLTGDQLNAKLNPIRNQKWLDIKAIRDAKIAGGVFVNNKWFHTDPYSLIQYLAMKSEGGSLIDVPNWKTMDGSKLTMTSTLVLSVYQTTMENTKVIYNEAEIIKANMLASIDPFNFDITTGWSILNYQETLAAN